MRETTTLFYRAGTSDKFYTAELDEDAGVVTFTWGRRGTAGQSKRFDLGRYGSRQKYAEKLQEKRNEGYTAPGGTPLLDRREGRCLHCNMPATMGQFCRHHHDRANTTAIPEELPRCLACHNQTRHVNAEGRCDACASSQPTPSRLHNHCARCGRLTLHADRLCALCRPVLPPSPLPAPLPPATGRRIQANPELLKKRLEAEKQKP